MPPRISAASHSASASHTTYRISSTTLSTQYSTYEPRRRAAAALARRKPAGAAALADEERTRRGCSRSLANCSLRRLALSAER